MATFASIAVPVRLALWTIVTHCAPSILNEQNGARIQTANTGIWNNASLIPVKG